MVTVLSFWSYDGLKLTELISMAISSIKHRSGVVTGYTVFSHFLANDLQPLLGIRNNIAKHIWPIART